MKFNSEFKIPMSKIWSQNDSNFSSIKNYHENAFQVSKFALKYFFFDQIFEFHYYRFVYAAMIAHLSYDMITQDQKLLFDSFPLGLMPLIAAMVTSTIEGFSLDRAACAQISIHVILIPVLMILFSFGLPRAILAFLGAPNAVSNLFSGCFATAIGGCVFRQGVQESVPPRFHWQIDRFCKFVYPLVLVALVLNFVAGVLSTLHWVMRTLGRQITNLKLFYISIFKLLTKH